MRAFFLLLSLLVAVGGSPTQTAPSTSGEEINNFNRQLEHATRTMNNAELMALWAEDGISLLPSSKPLVGKPAIAAFLDEVTTQLAGARMQTFEMQCSGINISGNWASEWCEEHQVVAFPDGKPSFDGRGRMLLVLHKSGDGTWRIQREMWNQA